MTKYLATKNLHKKEDKHPDFRLYMRDQNDEIIKEPYTKQDGTQGEGWKAFGALWCKVEEGKIKSMSIQIDDNATLAPAKPSQPVKEEVDDFQF